MMSRARALLRRRQDFEETFASPQGQRVLAYLSRFCRADQVTFDPESERISCLQEGRREVFLQINKYLHMTPAEIRHLQEQDNL